MLITCGLVCAYGIYGYYTGIAVRDERFIATFEYHSRIAKYISLFLPIAVCLLFYYRNVLTRLYLIIFILVCSFSLILTMNRTSWVAIFFTMLFIGFMVQRKLLVFACICTCALLFFVLPSKFTTHVKTITQVKEFFNSEKILGDRLLCWKASVAIIRDYPLLGIGPGKRNFRDAYQLYAQKIKNMEKQLKNEMVSKQPKEIKSWKKKRDKKIARLSHAHNIFLHIWTGTGIAGFLAFLWVFITVFYTAIKSSLVQGKRYEKTLLMGITASLISLFLHGFTDSFWKKPDALFLWYIIGLLFVFIHSTQNTARSTLDTPAANV
jgi:O-antigen ligase